MRDLAERDEIRAAHSGDTGTAGHIERLMGERENAAAYGQEDRVKELDEALGGFGYQAPDSRERAAKARRADAEKRAAGNERAGSEDSGEREETPRKQPPAARQSPAERKQAVAKGTPGQHKG